MSAENCRREIKGGVAMVCRGAIFLGFLTVAGGSLAGGRALLPNELFKHASESVVTVHAFDGLGKEISQGSGIAFESNGVVSNCHVVKDARAIQIGYHGRKVGASLRFSDTERDLCYLEAANLGALPVEVGSSAALEIGDRVYAIGAPQGLELTLSDGLVSNVRTITSGRVIQTTAAISPGSSGGGLFDDTGALVGITTMYLKDSQQLNFAVPVEWVKELPARHEEGARIAREAVNAWQQALEKSDPVGYAKRKARLFERARQIGANIPPDRWLTELIKIDDSLKKSDDAQAVADAIAAAADAKATAAAARPRERWLHVTEEDEASAYFDTETMKTVGDVVNTWIKVVFKKNSKQAKEGITYQLGEYKFNCSSRTVFEGAWSNYAKSGDIVYSGASTYRWTAVKPDSIGELWWKSACGV